MYAISIMHLSKQYTVHVFHIKLTKTSVQDCALAITYNYKLGVIYETEMVYTYYPKQGAKVELLVTK